MEAENLFKMNDIPFIDSTTISIEEMAAAIMHQAGLRRPY